MGIKSLFNHTVSQSSIVEVGTIVIYTSTSVPKGWLPCDGANYSITDYPQLYKVTNQSVTPNLNGRAIAGTSSSFGQGLNFPTGAETVTLTSAQSGSGSHSHASTISTTDHTHTYFRNSGSTFVGNTGTAQFFSSGSTSFTSYTTPTLTYTNVDTTAAAASAAHENMQPSLPINYIIKAG